MSTHGVFDQDYYFVAGNALAETQLSNASYPASGSYIDTTGYEWVNVVIHLGTIANTVCFKVQQTDATNGATLDTISTTLCKHTIATDDDGEYVTFYVQTANLATDHHFITCTVSGTTTGDYADINFFLGGARRQPVTQATATLPTASQHIFAG